MYLLQQQTGALDCHPPDQCRQGQDPADHDALEGQDESTAEAPALNIQVLVSHYPSACVPISKLNIESALHFIIVSKSKMHRLGINIARITKRCPENISLVVKVSCFLQTRCSRGCSTITFVIH